jgi:hypothetical protein
VRRRLADPDTRAREWTPTRVAKAALPSRTSSQGYRKTEAFKYKIDESPNDRSSFGATPLA